jgi:hypothetical protein
MAPAGRQRRRAYQPIATIATNCGTASSAGTGPLLAKSTASTPPARNRTGTHTGTDRDRISGFSGVVGVRGYLVLGAEQAWLGGVAAAGLANAAIAARLGLAPNTVSNHISSIFAKLRVASRAEAIVKARTAGLGDQ